MAILKRFHKKTMWYNTVSTGFDRLILFYMVIHGLIISDLFSKIPFLAYFTRIFTKVDDFQAMAMVNFCYLGPI